MEDTEQIVTELKAEIQRQKSVSCDVPKECLYAYHFL